MLEQSLLRSKHFQLQLAALFWLAHRLALERGDSDAITFSRAIEELRIAAEVLEECIERYKFAIVTDYAARYAGFAQSIFLGRHISYPFAMEAALKLKEVSYIFAQCYPAGELKHGPLALVDPKTPVFIFSHTNPLLYQKILSNVQEVKARRGHVVAFVFEGQHELIALADVAFVIPRVHDLLGPLAMTGVMQFLVYHIARVLGRPIDKPRNLAKSVTVE
jgi:glucosamine--fructose-6-phosphate aminotransferase (isomerizing)